MKHTIEFEAGDDVEREVVGKSFVRVPTRRADKNVTCSRCYLAVLKMACIEAGCKIDDKFFYREVRK